MSSQRCMKRCKKERENVHEFLHLLRIMDPLPLSIVCSFLNPYKSLIVDNVRSMSRHFHTFQTTTTMLVKHKTLNPDNWKQSSLTFFCFFLLFFWKVDFNLLKLFLILKWFVDKLSTPHGNQHSFFLILIDKRKSFSSICKLYFLYNLMCHFSKKR